MCLLRVYVCLLWLPLLIRGGGGAAAQCANPCNCLSLCMLSPHVNAAAARGTHCKLSALVSVPHAACEAWYAALSGCDAVGGKCNARRRELDRLHRA